MQAMLSNKSSFKNFLLAFASWSHHLCLQFIEFVFSVLFFPPFCNNLSACRTLSQCYASGCKNQLGEKGLAFLTTLLSQPSSFHTYHHFLTLSPNSRPSLVKTPLELSQKGLGCLWKLLIGSWLLFSSPAWKSYLPIRSIIANTSPKPESSDLVSPLMPS